MAKRESKPRDRAASSRRQISVQIKGSAEDGGYPRLSEFLAQLDAIKAALKHTERLASGSEEGSVYYRIVELRMASPATVVLEETAIRKQDRTAKLPRVPVTQRLYRHSDRSKRAGSFLT